VVHTMYGDNSRVTLQVIDRHACPTIQQAQQSAGSLAFHELTMLSPNQLRLQFRIVLRTSISSR